MAKKTLEDVVQDFIDSDGDTSVIENSGFSTEDVIEALQRMQEEQESAEVEVEEAPQAKATPTGGYRSATETESPRATFNSNADFGSIVGKLIYTAGSAAAWALGGLYKIGSSVIPQVVEKGAPIVGQTAGLAKGVFTSVVFKHDANGKVEKKAGIPVPQTWAKWVGGAAIVWAALPIAWYEVTSADAVIYTTGNKQVITPDQEYRFSGCRLHGVDSLNLRDPENLTRLRSAVVDATKDCTSKNQDEFELEKSFWFPKIWDPEDFQFRAIPEGNAICSMGVHSIGWRVSLFFWNGYIARKNVHGDVACVQPSVIMGNNDLALSDGNQSPLQSDYNVASIENLMPDTAQTTVRFNGQTIGQQPRLG